MRLREVARSAMRSLRANGMRTALTALGTIIGVASVIVVLAVGEGASADVSSRIRALGTNLLTIRPGAGGFGPVRSGSVETLTLGDAAAIARVPGVAAVAPEVSGSAQLRHRSENTSAQVIGVTDTYLAIRSLEVATGLSFDALDDRERRRVVILGANVAEELFGSASALGERVQIRGIAFRVIGVLERKGDAGFLSPDDMVLVPLATHQGVLFGQDHLSTISVQIEDEGESDAVQASIEELMRLRHRLRPDQEDDFSVRSQTEMLQTMGAVTGTLTALLGAVALVSLIVGGIGIMNIMLASVRERTREIGVRMAVGARRRDILLQFLAEAVVVSAAGGLVGLALGCAGAAAIARFGGWSTVVPAYGVVLALGVSLAVGVVFGVGPARSAARLDPVEALRTD
ncbi:ABC transporter permease [Sandaracinus amylolyticus]|uniref:Macrolide export ATP-binding/permease protein MacB n=1 Tax=Sandaracinus amylolyticus TaxID=927083 RepID=A0A0F6YHC3_9BACT|nr:ABC transporter permease [Sandaracinus amylolyticus]AKF04903.1 Macrolide export ATP-binding/permease protein MacB [Sandaracinus amylolyticus]